MEPTPPPPLAPGPRLDYGTSDFLQRPIVHVPILVIGCVFAALFTLVVFYVVPKFEEIFRDFGTKLPGPTVFLLSISGSLVSRLVTVIVVWLFAIVLPFVVAAMSPPRSPSTGESRRSLATTLYVLVIGALVLLICVALFAPMVSLIDAVNGKK